jgi:hypothetical protein
VLFCYGIATEWLEGVRGCSVCRRVGRAFSLTSECEPNLGLAGSGGFEPCRMWRYLPYPSPFSARVSGGEMVWGVRARSIDSD